MLNKKTFISGLIFTASVIAITGNASAAGTSENSKETRQLLESLKKQQDQLNSQTKALDEQLRKLQQQQKEIEAQRGNIQQLQKKIYAISGEKPPKDVTESPKSQPIQQAPSSKDDHVGEVGTVHKPEEKKRPPEVQTIAESGGVLLPKGTVVFEPSLEYSHSSATRVAIEGFTIIPALNVGSFDISQVRRDTTVSSVAGRLGLTNRFEMDVRVPYVYRNDSTFSRPIGVGAGSDELSEVSGDGIGDVEVGAHYQINQGKNGWPYFIANMRLKTATGTSQFDVERDPNTGLLTELPTGSGFYALQPSLTAIFPSDPAVFYANVGYLYNMAEDVGGATGEIDPGDSISASFGMGFSINDKSSFSIGYSHDTVFEPEQNGSTIPNTTMLQVGVLDVGYSYRLTQSTVVNLNVGAGLTEDSPDVRFVVRVPISKKLY